ncbi:HEPN domain-containing protein [Frankia sp. AgB32]|uniref:HEPN domain-containing protein n=1 Tax=Frankia sp. AgB32 TaxID=631119 RepID=UPI00201070C8|nr:HEPN domain-containing protein [Frankia sp. AgB32]MCK9897207.1 HEPN domain-containing protein [Frankia sp. AgB32]
MSRRERAEVWPPTETRIILDRLSELAALVQDQARVADNQEVVSWLARLLVIRSCGYLEQTVAGTFRAYTGRLSYGHVRNFSLGWLDRTQNPTPAALETLAGRFDQGLRQELSALLDADDGRLRRELATLVDRRNRIAHGLNESVGVRKALELHGVACEVADWFILRFGPS